MIVGVPREVMSWERRVSLTPSGAKALVGRGHTVLVEHDAGEGAGWPDEEYAAAGALLLERAAQVWERSDFVVKVKEPQPAEYAHLRQGLIIFTFLHLAAHPPLVEALLASGASAISYDTVELGDGSLPCLAPMSEIAGRIAVQEGAICLETRSGGRGVLVSGIPGVTPANVVIIGGGIAGTSACHLATGMGANVVIMDVSPVRLSYLHELFMGRVATVVSSDGNIREQLRRADLVVSTAHVTGARAPMLLDEEALDSMPRG
ncbi:MAG: alanine dehydrogenase, partial [Candidatus Geothermincolia bacterium]